MLNGSWRVAVLGITAAVLWGHITFRYIYDAAGKVLQVNRSTITPGTLSVFEFNPAGAELRALVTIQGQGLSTTLSLNVVKFGSVAAAHLSNGDENSPSTHYRSDSLAGMRFGEEVGISILQELAQPCTEDFDSFAFIRFDGTPVNIARNGELT